MSFFIVLNLFLAMIWSALLGSFSPTTMLSGYLIGFLVLFVSRRALPKSSYFKKVYQALGFVLFFMWELVIASLRVTMDVLSPRHHMCPRVIAYPLEARTQVEIVLLSNLLTLTPGSLSLDISSNQRILYVHAIYAEDKVKAIMDLRRLEERLLSLLRE
jgi:multicomponent Na+:H+ antiporter subunit E